MEPPAATPFDVPGDAYDAFMGRYSRVLAPAFADWAGVPSRPAAREEALDVGCGPGALTGELVARLGSARVIAVDPSASFVEACAARFPGVDVRLGSAESLPVEGDSVERALAQLVLHFVDDPEAAAMELGRVVRSGGTVAACVWDFAEGMQLLRAYWDAALEVDPDAPDEARTLRFGGVGEIAGLFRTAGFAEIAESVLTVVTEYATFDELWHGLLAGVGPAGAHCVQLGDAARARVRQGMFERVGSPDGPFTLAATARCARALVP